MVFSIGLTSKTKYSSTDSDRLEICMGAIAAGDRDALTSLYDQTRFAVFGYILSILGNRHDAEDILQEVYIRIYHGASRYRPSGKPMAWIFAVARNLALMHLRENRRRGDLSPEMWDAIPDAVTGMAAEDRMVLDAAMKVLSEEERRIVVLHAMTELKHRDIAEIMHMPLPTVLSKYHRAIKKMRQTLAEGDQ